MNVFRFIFVQISFIYSFLTVISFSLPVSANLLALSVFFDTSVAQVKEPSGGSAMLETNIE